MKRVMHSAEAWHDRPTSNGPSRPGCVRALASAGSSVSRCAAVTNTPSSAVACFALLQAVTVFMLTLCAGGCHFLWRRLRLPWPAEVIGPPFVGFAVLLSSICQQPQVLFSSLHPPQRLSFLSRFSSCFPFAPLLQTFSVALAFRSFLLFLFARPSNRNGLRQTRFIGH